MEGRESSHQAFKPTPISPHPATHCAILTPNVACDGLAYYHPTPGKQDSKIMPGGLVFYYTTLSPFHALVN